MSRLDASRDESWFVAWLPAPLYRAGLLGRLELRRHQKHQREAIRAALPYLHPEDARHERDAQVKIDELLDAVQRFARTR
jgi:hypothetical protein